MYNEYQCIIDISRMSRTENIECHHVGRRDQYAAEPAADYHHDSRRRQRTAIIIIRETTYTKVPARSRHVSRSSTTPECQFSSSVHATPYAQAQTIATIMPATPSSSSDTRVRECHRKHRIPPTRLLHRTMYHEQMHFQSRNITSS